MKKKKNSKVGYRWQRHGTLRGYSEVEPEAAYQELQRIARKRGSLDPTGILEESKRKTAVLHPMLTWDDGEAAHRYRISEARAIAYSCVRIVIDESGKEQQEPAVMSITIQKAAEEDEERRAYIPTEDARDNMKEALHLVRVLRGWLPRVRVFSVLSKMADAMEEAFDKAEQEIGTKE